MSSITPTAPTAVEPGGVWCPAGQQRVDLLAAALLEHPDVVEARIQARRRLEASPQFGVAGGPETIDAAVDNVLFSSLQFAANDTPAEPGVLWTIRLPYRLGDTLIPDSHYAADDPNRVYRCIPVRPDHRYEIRVRPHPTHPAFDDLSFESIPRPGLWGRTMVTLQRRDLERDGDGTFTVTADGTPANGRVNHLHLPPGTQNVVVRETLLDWANQVPSEIEVRRLDGPDAPSRTDDDVAREGVALFGDSIEPTLKTLEACLERPQTNGLVAFERPVNWGVAGALFGISGFDLSDDEALLITVDLLTAQYFSIVAADPWATSVSYDRHRSCLNNLQAQANEDGTYTFALGPKDPGIFNWLDTGGHRAGGIVARWESFVKLPPSEDREEHAYDDSTFAPESKVVPEAVREARVVPLADVAGAVPSGQEHVSPERRQALTARRLEEYRVRMTGIPLGEPDGSR